MSVPDPRTGPRLARSSRRVRHLQTRQTRECGLCGRPNSVSRSRQCSLVCVDVDRHIRSIQPCSVNEERRMAALHRRHARHEVLAARSDQRQQLQRPRGRLAVQDRQPRHRAPNTSSKARRSWSAACSTRRPARADRSSRSTRDRRADVGAPLSRRRRAAPTRRGSCRAAALAYWTDGRGDDRILYVTPGYRLIALNAKTGAARPDLRQGRRRRSEGRRRLSATASRSISRPARSACTRRRPSSRTSCSSARR